MCHFSCTALHTHARTTVLPTHSLVCRICFEVTRGSARHRDPIRRAGTSRSGADRCTLSTTHNAGAGRPTDKHMSSATVCVTGADVRRWGVHVRVRVRMRVRVCVRVCASDSSMAWGRSPLAHIPS